ncbi:MAG: helix-turn-helix transcriptional regulator [Saprospiraceae bacterium]
MENGSEIMYLASNIKLLRRLRKLSQEELANLIGLNRGNIASYENGTAEPRIGSLLKLADVFGISIEDIASKDLSDEHQWKGITRLVGLCPGKRAQLMEMKTKAADFQHFLNGIHTCFCFKSKDLSAVEDLPEAAHFLKSHFEQLHSATAKLAQEHQQLLELLQPVTPEMGATSVPE